MEKFSRRENVLLDYSTQRSFENPRSSSDADVDFDDVFGGPPKRASLHERRYRNNSEETVLSRSSSEKPVFGEDSVSRRRHASDDFFDDIFNGDDSSSSTPSRPFTPRVEPFASSLPSQSSLQAKMTKAMEPPAYAFTSSYNDQDEFRNDVKSSYRQSRLSHEFSFRSRESSKVIDSDEKDVVGNLKQDFKVADIPSSPSQFHFSIYTWPGIGLPLVMPLRRRSAPKGKDKIDISSSYNHLSKSKVHDADSVLLNHGTSSSTESLKIKSEKKNRATDIMNSEKKDRATDVMKSEKKDRAIDVKGQGYERKENLVRKEHANANVGKTVNNIKETRTESSRVEAEKAAVQSTPDENLRTDGAKGKVKESVGAFNQGTSSNPKISGDTINHSFRQKGAEESGSTKKVDKKIHIPNLSRTRATSASVNENIEQSKKQYSRTESSFYTSVGNSSGPREASSFSKTKSPVSKATMENLDDIFQDDFVIKELPDYQEQTSDSGQEEKDAIRAWDAKVQKWSYGKKGNIRSLLSTLQFVLWTGSGWKPVPLVDVIEGNAVKKAYQKALLCLHPDKLQQKGAASDQKYIAEKVFDILQEAWDQFNAMGSL